MNCWVLFFKLPIMDDMEPVSSTITVISTEVMLLEVKLHESMCCGRPFSTRPKFETVNKPLRPLSASTKALTWILGKFRL